MSQENVEMLGQALAAAPADPRPLFAIVENRTWQVFAFRGGKVIHCRGYGSKGEALKAVGLSERDISS